MRNYLIYALKDVFSKRIFYGDVKLNLILGSLVTTGRSGREPVITGSFLSSRHFDSPLSCETQITRICSTSVGSLQVALDSRYITRVGTMT